MAHSFNNPVRLSCDFDGCIKDFAREPDKQRHVKESHGKPWLCSEPGCDWPGAKRKSRLYTHRAKKHPEAFSQFELDLSEYFSASSASSPYLLTPVPQLQGPEKSRIVSTEGTVTKVSDLSSHLPEENTYATQLARVGHESYSAPLWNSAYSNAATSKALDHSKIPNVGYNASFTLLNPLSSGGFDEMTQIAPSAVSQVEESTSQACDGNQPTSPPMAELLARIDLGSNQSPTLSVEKDTPVSSQHSESLREEFLDAVFDAAASPVTRCATTTTNSPGDNSRNQTSAPSLDSLLSHSSRGATLSNRRRQRDDGDEEQDDSNRAPKRERLSQGATFEQDRFPCRRIACHFHLFQKDIYCKNKRTGKKYETCSGPGWPTMHHLKQHLANSVGAVHKKIRCPRCLIAFKSASAVLKHQKSKSEECQQQSTVDQDDIDDDSWTEIQARISQKGFNLLPLDERAAIDQWVVQNLGSPPSHHDEERKWDLRKWNMTWKILFPNQMIPASPFYDDYAFMSMTNTELLVRSFKETVDLMIESNDIEGIDEDTLNKLLESLRLAISVASASSQEQRGLLRRRILTSASNTGTLHSSRNSDAELNSKTLTEESTAGLEGMTLIKDSYPAPPILGPSLYNISGHQFPEMTMNMPQEVLFSAPGNIIHSETCFQTSFQSGFPFSQSSVAMNTPPFEAPQDPLDAISWDQFELEWNTAFEPLNPSPSRNASEAANHEE